MSMQNDVRDILSLPAVKRPGPSSNRSGSVPRLTQGPPKPRAKRKDGVTRELYNLLGDNAPSLSMVLPKPPKMKEKFKVKQKAVKWDMVSFENLARKDGLKLSHWAPKVEQPATKSAEYKFAAYNTSSPVYSYSSEEYLRFLRDDDWTREETDYLFELCSAYDLRFVIIYDRYEFKGTTRTLEDLKDRYYTCCRRLIRERPAADENIKAQAANSYAFDKNREISRKAYLRSLMDRRPQQIAEEEFLYVESRKLEQTYARTTRERDDLLRMMGGVGSGASIPNTMLAGTSLPGSTAPSRTGSILLGGSTSRKRGRGEDDLDASTSGGKSKNKPMLKPDPVFDAQHFITHHIDQQQASTYGLPKTTLTGPSVYLRSSRTPYLKPDIKPRVTEALAEMGISERLVMPTKANTERLEALTAALGTLVELKKQIDRTTYELDVTRKRTVKSVAGAAEEEEDANGEADTSVQDAEAPERSQRSESIASSSASGRPQKKRRR